VIILFAAQVNGYVYMVTQIKLRNYRVLLNRIKNPSMRRYFSSDLGAKEAQKHYHLRLNILCVT